MPAFPFPDFTSFDVVAPLGLADGQVLGYPDVVRVPTAPQHMATPPQLYRRLPPSARRALLRGVEEACARVGRAESGRLVVEIVAPIALADGVNVAPGDRVVLSGDIPGPLLVRTLPSGTAVAIASAFARGELYAREVLFRDPAQRVALHNVLWYLAGRYAEA